MNERNNINKLIKRKEINKPKEYLKDIPTPIVQTQTPRKRTRKSKEVSINLSKEPKMVIESPPLIQEDSKLYGNVYNINM